MKKIRVFTLFLTVVLVLLSFTSCMHMATGGDGTDAVTTDEYENHMDVQLLVYSYVDMDTQKELSADDRVPVIGAAPLTVGYEGGAVVTPIDALNRLADIRGAELDVVSGTITSITYDGVTYTIGQVLGNRYGTVDKTVDNKKTTVTVQYYDIYYWRWTLNGTVLESTDGVELKNDDYLVLELVYDTTSTADYEEVVEEES